MKTIVPALTCMAGLAALTLATGCTSLQTVSVTQVPPQAQRNRPIKVEESNTAFLGIHFDNEFVDQIPTRLGEQCPGGKVTGILTKYENTWYVIIQTREVVVTAYCVYDTPVVLQPGRPAAAEASP